MATSGTFIGTRGASAYGPWLILDWSRIDVDIPNNRSLIRLNLKLASDRNIVFSATKSGVLDGTSFSYTGNYNGPETRTIKTKDVWVSHNSDGSRTEAFSATFDVNISWSGEWLGRLSVSGNAVIDTIPRASDFTAFTLSNTVLNTGVATTINYTLARKSTSFDHDMTLKYGSSVIATWSATTGSLTRSLTATEVNTILRLMSTVTSGTLTLTMQTMSGTVKIGSTKTISEGVTVSSAVAPTSSGVVASIFGTGRDKALGMYIQGISKVTASFTSTAGYGASISASTINVKKSDGTNSQVIGGNSGTTPNPISGSGTYTVTGTVKDSRGRSASATINITVQAYSQPSIIKFTGVRGVPTTTVNLGIDTRWSPLGTSNPATIKITGTNSVASTTLLNQTGDTTGIMQTTKPYTAQSDAYSYTYTISVTDSFGANAQAQVKIGTTFVELTIAKGLGIGIGKVHERGSLDVAGNAHVKGFLDVAGLGQGDPNAEGALRITGSGKAAKIQYGTAVGMGNHAYLEWAKNGIREAYIGFGSDNNDNFLIYNQRGVGFSGMLALGDNDLTMVDTTATYNGVPAFSSGNKKLWEGAAFMNDTQTIYPTKEMDDCPHGWMLVFSYYASGTQDIRFSHHFISKEFVANKNGMGTYLHMYSGDNLYVLKYLYLTNTGILGFAGNQTSPNNRMVLRYVFEV